MKPLHTRPFNLEHARAGAPFACANGELVEILKWDRKHTQCILGLARQDAAVRTWRANGSYGSANDARFDLVMTPLGLIDGKPVFVGDELIDPAGSPFVPGPLNSGHLAGCRWPAPAPVLPEFTGDLDHLRNEYNSALGSSMNGALERVANAALRHEVEAGRLVIPGEPAAGLRPYNPYTGRRRDQRDIDSDPMGKLICHQGEPNWAANPGYVIVADSEDSTWVAAVKHRVALLDHWTGCMSYNDSYFGEPSGLVKMTVRSLAYLMSCQPSAPSLPIVNDREIRIATAIRDVCMAKVEKNHNGAARELLEIDLPSIVASLG